MTTLPSLPDAPSTVSDNELIYVVSPTVGNSKRTLGWLVAYFLGPTASAFRGFFGATPVQQPASSAQAAAPATPIGGTAGGTYTATEQQMINDLKDRVNALTTLCNAQRAALVSLGLMKGSA